MRALMLGLLLTGAWLGAPIGVAAYSVFVSYVYAVLPNIRYDLAVDLRAPDTEGSLFLFIGRVIRTTLH